MTRRLNLSRCKKFFALKIGAPGVPRMSAPGEIRYTPHKQTHPWAAVERRARRAIFERAFSSNRSRNFARCRLEKCRGRAILGLAPARKVRTIGASLRIRKRMRYPAYFVAKEHAAARDTCLLQLPLSDSICPPIHYAAHGGCIVSQLKRKSRRAL